MNKEKPNKRSESGITLIALLVMIILIVILAAVTVKGLAGNEGLLSVAGTAAEEHKIAVYKERINNNVRETIVTKAVLGKTATLRRHSRKLKKRNRLHKRGSNRRRRNRLRADISM